MAKIIRITHQDPEILQELFESAMDIACVAALSYCPTDSERKDKANGRYWDIDQDDPNKVHLAPIANNHWARITKRGPDFMEIEFSYRYDRADRFANVLAELIAARWPDEIQVLLTL